MKKIISLLMTVFMLASVLSVGALADAVPSVLYVTDSIGTELTDGDTIATVEGQLTVVFDSAVTDAALEGISIEAVSGSFKGAVAATIDTEDNTKVNVRFGRLEDGGEYVLNVPAASFVFGFAAEVKYHTNPDFDTWTSADNLSEKLSAANLQIINRYTKSVPELAKLGTFSEKGGDPSNAENGHNYIGIAFANCADTSKYKKADWTGMVVTGDFNDTTKIDKDKVYVLDTRIDTVASETVQTRVSGKINFGALGDGVNNRIGNNANTVLISSGSVYKIVDTTGGGTFGADATMYSPRLVLKRTESGALQQMLYAGNANGGYDYIGVNTKTVSSTQSVTQLTVVAATNLNTNVFTVRSVVCYPERLLSVIKADPYEGGETRQLVLNMSDEFDADAVSSENIVVKNVKGGEVTDCEISADSYERTITLTFPDGLRKGNYTVETNGMIGSNGLKGYSDTLTFEVDTANGIEYYETKNYTVTDADGNPVLESNITGIAQANVAVDVISDEGNEFTMALVIYDKDDRVVRIAADSKTIAEGNDRVTLNVSTPDDMNIGEGYTVRPLVWLDDSKAGAIFVEEFDKLTALSAQ